MTIRVHGEYRPSAASWLGSLPAHWDEKPLFAVAKERAHKNLGMKERNLLSLSYGQIIRKDINSNGGLLPDSFETYQIVEEGDLVFRFTDLQNDKRSLRSALCNERGIITSAYTVIYPTDVKPSFLSYLMRAYDVQKVFYSMGGGLRQSLGFDDVRRMPVLLPSPAEQEQITTFLDRETNRIDSLIRKKESFLGLLQEKLRALITLGVTRGTDPSLEMVFANEWLGSVPAHWRIGRVRDFSDRINTGPFGTALKAESYVEGGVPILNPSHLAGDKIRPEANVSVLEEKAEALSFWALREGDVITARRGELGRSAVVSAREAGWICGTGSMIVRPSKTIRAHFVQRVLQSSYARAWLEKQSVGSTMPNLSERLIGSLPVAVPPTLDEQDTILDSLGKAESQLDILINKTTASIELLKERRSALITAAVTGKMDVRTAA